MIWFGHMIILPATQLLYCMVLGATERYSHKGKKLKVRLMLDYVNISITLITSSKVAALKSEPHCLALDLNSCGDKYADSIGLALMASASFSKAFQTRSSF